LLKLTGLVATVAGGFGLGRTTAKVHVRVAILTALLAAFAHAGLKLVLPHDAIEQLAQSQLLPVSGQIVLMALAIVEMAGVLFPVALTPWAAVSIRAWATLYLLGAAFLAAATFYFPFDVVIMNDEVIGPKHPSYELGLVFSLPFGALGYVLDGSNGDSERPAERHEASTTTSVRACRSSRCALEQLQPL
jgi:hypothetical protein